MNVSRETTERLTEFVSIALKWNKAINLISNSSADDIWNRHVADSAQLFDLGGNFAHWADLGSGGGFPGLVVAIISKEKSPSSRFTLVESDQRKCAYLEHIARTFDLNITVIPNRIEKVSPLVADVLSARALAPLVNLCGYAHKHLSPQGISLFPKGARHGLEIEEAEKEWCFNSVVHSSCTDKDAVILELRSIRHV